MKKLLFLVSIIFTAGILFSFSVQETQAATETLRPSSSGTNTEFTPNTGENWAAVNEATSNGDTTYIANAALGVSKYDTYNLPAPTGLGTINSVKVYFTIRTTNTINSGAAYALVRTNSVRYTAVSGFQPTTTYVLRDYAWTFNPNTGSAWLWPQIDALEIGVSGFPSGAGEMRATQVYVEVNYTPVVIVAPTVSTNPATLVEETTATGNGNITSLGGAANVTERGFKYGLTPTDTWSASDTGTFVTGAYTKAITGLSPGTLYYIRAFAVNSAGTGYGSYLSFLTKPNEPSAFTATPGNTQLTLNWTKGAGASKTLIRRSTSAFPTVPTGGSGITDVYLNTGTSYTDTGLTNGTTYYYSAWSSTTTGIWTQVSDAYVSISGVPTSGVVAPTVSTNAATLVEETTATGNGNITSLGGAANVTEKGFKYGLTQTDTWSASDSGTFGTGAYTKAITGLSPGTLYYIRAFAVNSAGTGYGSYLSFLTKPNEPASFTATPASTQLTLNWTKGTGASKTLIRRSTSAFPTVPTGGSGITDVYLNTGTSYTDTGLTNGTTYYYSAWSSTTSGVLTQYSDLLNATVSGVPAVTVLYEYNNGGYDGGYQVWGDNWKGQTFIPAVNHKITIVKLLLNKGGSGAPGTVTVSIRATDAEGKPTNADLLCSGTTDGDTLPWTPTTEWRAITLVGTGCNLNASTKYAIVVRYPSGNTFYYIQWYLSSSNPYTNGNSSYSGDGGSSWNSEISNDFLFEEWGIGAPTVTTDVATVATVDIVNNIATLKGNITNTGGQNADIRGFEWGLSSGSYPNSWTEGTSGSYVYGAGSFNYNLSGLSLSTIYYYRAKAKNSVGWGYGTEKKFVIYTAAGVQQSFATLIGNQPPNKPLPVGDGETWNNCTFQDKNIPTFHWTYSDPDGDLQAAYEIWIASSTNPTFADPKFNHLVNIASTAYTLTLSHDDNSDWITELAWNTIYYWKVKVKDNQNNWSVFSDYNSFTTPLHAYPWSGFSWLPQEPNQGEVVVFDPEETNVYYLWTFNEGSLGTYETADSTSETSEEPHIKFLISNNKAKLKVTDKTPQVYSCESAVKEITAQLPLPEYKEVPPIIWLKKALAILVDFFNVF